MFACALSLKKFYLQTSITTTSCFTLIWITSQCNLIASTKIYQHGNVSPKGFINSSHKQVVTCQIITLFCFVLGQRIHFKQYCEFLVRGFRSRNPKNCWRKFDTHCKQSWAGLAPHTSHARQTPIPEDPCPQQVAQCHPLGEWSPGIASSYLCPPPIPPPTTNSHCLS